MTSLLLNIGAVYYALYAPSIAHSPAMQRLARQIPQRSHVALISVVLLSFAFTLFPASAQDTRVLDRGMAVVTGFAGTTQSDGHAGNPLDETFIDLDGASAEIIKLEPGAPPTGQIVSAPPVLAVNARDVGQVFAVGLDAVPGSPGEAPNIYLGATSAFGLQLVVPDSDGDGRAERSKTGHANAEWMAGQFGEGGGPGSIWKVDGKTGAVSLFATIPDNSGPGLGDIVFDPATRQFFVSDLDTGLIHRLDASGAPVDTFDHGQAGRAAAGLAPIGDDGTATDIKSPAFDSQNPATWGFTQAERRVWGLGLRAGRLYYAVAEGPAIWSVSIGLDGAFGNDPRLEIEVSGTPANHPISDIAFDNVDYMYVAQRGGIKGSYDYTAFTDAQQSVVFRFKREIPDDPATPGIWVPIPDEYAVGFPPDHRNISGGVALGYGYDKAGAMQLGACDAFVWSTGDALRDGGSGSGVVHGLQGNARSLIRPDNEPPSISYFVDYDGTFDGAEKLGHVGDIEIWQPCDPKAEFGFYAPAPYVPGYPVPGSFMPPPGTPPGELPPGYPPPPPGLPEGSFNLRLDKEAIPGTCVAGGLGFICDYVVRVTNTGPDPYIGQVVINDKLPAAPAGAVMTFAGVPPWLCFAITPTEHQCMFGPTALLPGDSVDLYVSVDLPVAAPVCHLDNLAQLVWPFGFGDANPLDDFDLASATIPAAHCPPPPPDGEKTNLRIWKHEFADVCTDKFGFFECEYLVVVRNIGTADYDGEVKIGESIPAGATASFPQPSWTCSGAAPDYVCASGPVTLPPGQAVQLYAVVNVPKGAAPDLGCEATNKAKIVEAAGGTDLNTDPTDDEAEATMILPGAVSDCPELGPLSNLKLFKTGPDEKCPVAGSDWVCEFKIRLQNFGDAYTSAVQIIDALPLGSPPGASVSFTAPAGWTCGGPLLFPTLYQCSSNNPNLAHMESVEIVATVKVPVAPTPSCAVTNNAQIVKAPGGTLLNSFAGDDFSSATTQFSPVLPLDGSPAICASPAIGEPMPPLTTPPGKETNLTIEKSAGPSQATATGQNTVFTITVTNQGPGAYNGPIEVRDTLFDGTTVEPSNGSWSAPWVCEGQGASGHPEQGICTHPAVALDAGKSIVLTLEIEAPNSFVAPTGSQATCGYENKVEILKPAGGTPQNTNAGDDTATAKVKFAPFEKHGQKFCEPGLTTTPPSCPQGWSSTPVAGKCCPPRSAWDGESCKRDVQPPETCPKGFKGTPPNCVRIVDPPKVCPKGFRGSPPNCIRIVEPPKVCPKGFKGTPPNCVRIVEPPKVCPKGFRGTPPDCVRIVEPPKVCPKGFRGTPPNCVRIVDPPKVCPKGFRGTPPNCVRIVDPPRVCPKGFRGTPPNCVRIVDPPQACPKGFKGTPPNCKRIVEPPKVCPKGFRGTPPNCKRIVIDPPKVCPKGFRGTPPNCKRIVVVDPPKVATPKVCPKGFRGTPPNCKKIGDPPSTVPGTAR